MAGAVAPTSAIAPDDGMLRRPGPVYARREFQCQLYPAGFENHNPLARQPASGRHEEVPMPMIARNVQVFPIWGNRNLAGSRGL